jgi:hypothetical protein
MGHRVLSRAALPLFLFLLVLSRDALALNSTWFDINPSTSNLDASDPNGASGGRVNKIGAASDLSRIYATTEWGGLYTSFDQGNTWVKINTFSPTATWDVKVDPSNNQRVYVTSFFDGRVTPLSGIDISDDAGTTWRNVDIATLNTLTCSVSTRKSEPHAWQISINPGNSAVVFIGTSCGLARTIDTGKTWTFIDPSPGDGTAEQVYAVASHAGQTVDVITDNGFFRSPDNGKTWSAVLSGQGPTSGNSGTTSSLAVSPAESYVLLASDTTDIFETDNGGTSWPTSLTLPVLPGGSTNVQGRIPFVKTNQLSTSNQFDVWFGDINLFKTTAITPSTAAPGGAARTPVNSWTNVQSRGHWDTGDVLFDGRAIAGACPWLLACDGGLYKNQSVFNPSCQGPQWAQPAITPHATWAWGMDGVRLSPGTHALTCGFQDVGGYAALNVAEGYNPPSVSWNNYTCCDVFHNEDGARIFSVEGFFPNGRNFPLFIRNRDGSGANQPANYPSNANAVIPTFDSGGQTIPLGANGAVVNLTGNLPRGGAAVGGVYTTGDVTSGNISWSSLNAPSSATSSSGSIKLANLGGQPNVYYHTGNGNPESQGLIFRSTLTGTIATPGSNWVPLTLPRGVGTVTVWDVDPTNGNRVIVSGINSASNTFEIWRTPDFGATWTRLTSLENLMLGASIDSPNFWVNSTNQGRTSGFLSFGTYWQPSLFKFDPINSTTILAGAVDSGVFLSLDDGVNWQRISNPTNPTSNSPHIPRPLFAYFSPGRFNASTNSFDVWVGTRGAGVQKVVIDQ